jgi:hypothetical protein
MAQEESVTGQEIFNEAVADAPPPQEEVAPEPKAEEPRAEASEESKSEGRQRDEKGRFAAKEEAPPVEAAVEAPNVETPKQDHRIPLTELLNEREKRQSAERQREAVQQQLWQLQQQLQAAQKPAEEPIDIFANPEAYTAQVQQTMEQRMKAMEGNFSLRLAHYKHGELFGEAWQEMTSRTQAGDDSMRQQVLGSSDPGETLVQLYQREKLMKEVGPDPMAYVNQKLEAALEDEAFLQKAYEKFKAKAGGQSPQAKNKIELPPSLNKVASAGAVDGDTDMSGGSLYHFATR